MNSTPGAPKPIGFDRDWCQFAPFCLFVAVAIACEFPDVLFGFKSFFYRDYAIFGYPLACYHKDRFWHGEIPLWNPYNNCGLPFLSQWNTLALYPLSLIYLLLPLPWSLSLFCLAHLFIAAAGAHRLARAWTKDDFAAAMAGLSFALGGLALSCLKWPNNIAALAWFPWLLWSTERAWKLGGRALVLSAIIGATQMLSGAPEMILFSWIFLASLMILQWLQAPQPRAIFWPRFVGVVLLISGLSAAQLLPFLELLHHSQRGASYSDASWSMPALGWLNLAVPLFHCFPSHEGVFAQFGQYWISSYYPGIMVVFLAALAVWKTRRPIVIFLFVFLILGAWMAMGTGGRLYSLVRHVFPFLGFVRFPIKFIIWTSFLLPFLAGFGAAELSKGAKFEMRLIVVPALATAGLAVAAIAIGCAFPLSLAAWPISLERQTLLVNAVTRLLALGGFVGLLYFRRHPNVAKQATLFCLAWLALDLFTHAPRLNPVVDPWVLEPSAAQVPIIEMPNGPPRLSTSRAMISPEAERRLDHLAFTNAINDVLYSRKALFANCNLIDGIPKVDGFYSLYVKEENNLRAALEATNFPGAIPLRQLAGVSDLTAPGKIIDWQLLPKHLPLLTAGQQPVFVTNNAVALERMLSAPFDPSATVYIRLAPGQSMPKAHTAGPVRISEVNAQPQRISATIDAIAPHFVLMTQTAYPGWKAWIDGAPSPLYQADYAFQAVEVPAGNHQLELRFQSASFRLGSAISLATLAIVALLAWKTRCQDPAP